MATMDSGAVKMTWKDIQALDRVGPSYRPVQEMSAKRKARILLLVHREFGYGGDHAMLVHEERGVTFLRGRCPSFGLDAIRGDTTERECEELRDRRVVQAIISGGMGAYVVTDDGVLFSCGAPKWAQLGRRATTVSYNKFGRVVIDGPVLAVAAGNGHVLAMTATKVFAFGLNGHNQAGVPELPHVPEPRKIYSGGGPFAPKQVACGHSHSVILTVGGQVLTCGQGLYNGHGHEKNVAHMTQVKLGNDIAQQIGCTWGATYALAKGVLYGWGDNNRGCLCVSRVEQNVLEPTVVDCLGRRISSFRCSFSMVLALLDTGEALRWGKGSDGTMVIRPWQVKKSSFPREVFASGWDPDSGGTVYLDTPENNNHVFAATTDAIVAVGMKPTELANAVDMTNERTQDVDEVFAAHAPEEQRRNLLARLAEQQRQIDALQKSNDQQETRHQEQINDLLATQTQQQPLIDELLSNQAELQRREKILQERTDQQQRQLARLAEQQRQIDALQKSNDRQEARHKERINDLLATQRQQQQLIDELLSNKAELQRREKTLQERDDQQQRQIRELKDSIDCPICLNSRRDVVFLCGHSACRCCSAQLDRCHSCRNQITTRISFF